MYDITPKYRTAQEAQEEPYRPGPRRTCFLRRCMEKDEEEVTLISEDLEQDPKDVPAFL